MKTKNPTCQQHKYPGKKFEKNALSFALLDRPYEASSVRCAHENARNLAILMVALISLLMGVSVSAWAQPVVFAQLSIPAGITTDSHGNVYIHSDAVTTTTLTKYTPGGTPVAQISLGGINVSEFGGSRLTRIPNTDFMLLLSPQGQIFYFTPELQGGPWIDLRPLAGQVANGVYDVLRQDFHSLSLGVPHYGDITSRWAGENLLDLFLTATTGASGGFPFVMRLRLDFNDNTADYRVMVTSQGTTAGNVNLPPGIAVNASGQVLTTLPFPVSDAGFADGLVAFSANFTETKIQNDFPQFILQDSSTQSGIIDLASSGMTVDEAGNFYITTGVVGSSLCGAGGSGALVFIGSNLNTFECLPLGSALVRSADVAVSPTSNFIYMTITDFNGAVIRFDPIVPLL